MKTVPPLMVIWILFCILNGPLGGSPYAERPESFPVGLQASHCQQKSETSTCASDDCHGVDLVGNHDDRILERDVVVYGGTSSAIVAAIQVAKMGKTVALVSPDKHLGGMTINGLGWTDSGNKAAIGGLGREFYHRLWKHYQDTDAWRFQPLGDFKFRSQGPSDLRSEEPTVWVFEPHVAEAIFLAWLKEHQIDVRVDHWLDRENGVDVSNAKIQSIRTTNGCVFVGKMFIDATYEGDLLDAAGVDFHVGRESNGEYQERWNGVQTGTFHHAHWFDRPVDPYVVPGDPTSGLLRHISPEPPGRYGAGDQRVQAYCFRLCMTNVPENRIDFTKPPGYDPQEFELLGRLYDAGWRWKAPYGIFDAMPNRKTDTNNHGPFSTDYIGGSNAYPLASYQERRQIVAEHRRYQQGLMYFLTNDPRVPEDVRAQYHGWGLSKDEFVENEGWPYQIYVREARRMVGCYVMTEHDCLGKTEIPDPVGMGSYTLDSHNCHRYVTAEGHVQNEGDVGVKTPGPYQVSYRSLVPKPDQCGNLLVPVCISSSHIAFGSIRMEPVFMILGQSAATAACLSIDNDCPVQSLSYETLQQRLLLDGQVLTLTDP